MFKKITVIGPTCIDRTIILKDTISLDGSSRIKAEKEIPGGTGYCYAIALSRLGNDIFLHSVIGNDQKGVKLLHTVKKERNINVHFQIEKGKTDYSYILIDSGNHKTVASRKIISNKFILKDVVKNIASSDALVLSSFSNNVIVEVLNKVSKLKKHNSYIMWAPHRKNCEESKIITKYLGLINHITLSSEEYEILCDKIGNPLDYGVSTITVTRGKNGCDFLTHQSIKHFAPTEIIHNPLDTNGAGEAFGSGYLTTLLHTNNYETAVKAGSHLALMHIQKFGSDFPKIHHSELRHIVENTIIRPSEFGSDYLEQITI